MFMLEDVKSRLVSLNYTPTEADTWILNFFIQKVENYIKNDCNISEIPEGLHQVAVDMAAGEFLLSKKSIGQLTGFDLDAAVKSITEGDTNVSFDISHSPEQRLDALILYLMNHGKGQLASYRCIKW
jgi:hypothetical protein